MAFRTRLSGLLVPDTMESPVTAAASKVLSLDDLRRVRDLAHELARESRLTDDVAGWDEAARSLGLATQAFDFITHELLRRYDLADFVEWAMGRDPDALLAKSGIPYITEIERLIHLCGDVLDRVESWYVRQGLRVTMTEWIRMGRPNLLLAGVPDAVATGIHPARVTEGVTLSAKPAVVDAETLARGSS